jgi:hypothetical protein
LITVHKSRRPDTLLDLLEVCQRLAEEHLNTVKRELEGGE